MERLQDEFEGGKMKEIRLSGSVKLLHVSCLSFCLLIYIHPIT